MFDLAELKRVIPLVRASVPPTPQCAWPLLRARTGVEIVVKHENNTPIGAFKVRGGIVYFDRLKRARPQWGSNRPSDIVNLPRAFGHSADTRILQVGRAMA
jgi:threonine dehydratase